MSFTIEVLTNIDEEWYYLYLKKNPHSLIYVTPRFMRLISHHLDANPEWLVAKRDDKILGILPFMVKNGDLGPVLNSLPYYGSNGGVIQVEKNDEVKKCLISEFYNLAEDMKALSATIITNPLEMDFEIYESVTSEFRNFTDKRIGQFTFFPNQIQKDDLIKLFDDPRPRNIRKALKLGVVVKEDKSDSALDFIYTIHFENISSIGGVPKEKSFFELIPKFMKDDEWTIYLAVLDGEPIAGLLLFYFNLTAEYYTPVIKETYRSTQALSLVIYKAMQDALEKGIRNWNWGGTWLSQKGVYNFKKKWGSRDLPYFYYVKASIDKIKNFNKKDLQNMYKGFYVIPYADLEVLRGG